LLYQVLCPDLVVADWAYPPDHVKASEPERLVSCFNIYRCRRYVYLWLIAWLNLSFNKYCIF